MLEGACEPETLKGGNKWVEGKVAMGNQSHGLCLTLGTDQEDRYPRTSAKYVVPVAPDGRD